MRKIIYSLLLLSFTSMLFAQKGNEKVELQVFFRDGSNMKGTTKLNTIELKTDYGKLEIPVKNVNSIEFGIVENRALKDKIIAPVKLLSDPNEEIRGKAYKDIIDMGIQAIPALKAFIASDKYEPDAYADYTAESALKELQILNNINDNASDKDVVNFDNVFVVGGTYNLSNINLETEHGALNISRDKIKKIDVYYFEPGDGSQKTFNLAANKYISGNNAGGWLATNINVKVGQRIEITATGEVFLASLAASYKPDGTYVSTTNNVGNEGDPYNYNTGTANTYPTYGSLVYKIGQNGQAIKAGSKYSGVANNSGIIYISIYETVFNATNTGSYNVKIKVR